MLSWSSRQTVFTSWYLLLKRKCVLILMILSYRVHHIPRCWNLLCLGELCRLSRTIPPLMLGGLWLLLLILVTSPWGLSELWGGGVPTPDIDHSGPSLCRLILRSLIIGPAPPSSPAVWCSTSLPFSFACLHHRHHMIIFTPGCPLSPSQHTKNPSPSLLSPITSQYRLLLPYLAPITPVGFPSPPLPVCCQNIFQCGLQWGYLVLMVPVSKCIMGASSIPLWYGIQATSHDLSKPYF